MSLGPSICWVLAGLASAAAVTTSLGLGQVGVVVTVDRDKGQITLVFRGGTRFCLTAHPSLLKDVRIGGPVHVVTDGAVIQSLRCL